MKFNQDHLIPAIIQDADTLQVLMLGYMNQAAYDATVTSKQVTLSPASKEAQDFTLVSMALNETQDAVLIKVITPHPAEHNGVFGEKDAAGAGFLAYLEKVILDRIEKKPAGSYTATLMQEGVLRLAQKVGEEGVEVALASVAEQDKLCDEMADLWYHALMLLVAKGYRLQDVIIIMQQRYHALQHKG
jgi:phosphoribosyl-ATP pyrophosphohydrolase/phosphoribosyl-AMP cyclohydrolase